jgi:hypothetical protein
VCLLHCMFLDMMGWTSKPAGTPPNQCMIVAGRLGRGVADSSPMIDEKTVETLRNKAEEGDHSSAPSGLKTQSGFQSQAWRYQPSNAVQSDPSAITISPLVGQSSMSSSLSARNPLTPLTMG